MDISFNISRAFAVFWKDLLSELKTRYAVSTTILFVVISISIVIFSFKDVAVEPQLVVGLLWIIMFFSASVGLSRSYISEEERETSILLKLISSSGDVFLGKLLFNIIYSVVINFISAFLLLLLLDVRVNSIFSFSAVYFFCSLCMASVFSITSAIISKANTKNALLPIVSFPLIIPILIVGIEAMILCIEGISPEDLYSFLGILNSYFGIFTIISYIVFVKIWQN